jgi:hypothetical protein
VSNVIKSAYDSASFLCEEYYNMAPDLSLKVAFFQDHIFQTALHKPKKLFEKRVKKRVASYMIPKTENMYQMNTKCTKWS